MLRHILISAVSLTLLTVPLASPSARVQAHELRAVGNYRLEVGFLNEPALIDELNAIFVGVRIVDEGAAAPSAPPDAEKGHEGEPVGGAEQTLSAEVIVGGDAASKPLELSARPEERGTYVAPFIPTLAGDYTFRIFGELGGQPIDERFSSGPETFDPVTGVAEIQFPEQVPSSMELAQSIDQLSERLSGQDTGSDSNTALIIAIIGLVAGAAGIGLAGYAISTRKR